MQRIAIILLLFILLTSAPHFGQEPPLRPTANRLIAQPLPIPPPSVLRDYGPLRLLGFWRLTGSPHSFGGISSLLVDGDGRLTGLDDSGEWIAFGLDGRMGRMSALPRAPEQVSELRRLQDTESVTRDPATGRIWVGFEAKQRICRYPAGFARVERCVLPPAMQDWPESGGAESLVRLGDGRFMAIGERASAPDGGHDVVLWAGDPVDPSTPSPAHLSFHAPTGYVPTDAIWLGGDRLLVLTRRMTVADWFTAKLTLVRLPWLQAGAVLRGEVIASFVRPGPIDNLEALALSREKSGPILWIASDDNHLFLQRTLLFKFALPKDWVNEAPAP
jgi:hypothetical protein